MHQYDRSPVPSSRWRRAKVCSLSSFHNFKLLSIYNSRYVIILLLCVPSAASHKKITASSTESQFKDQQCHTCSTQDSPGPTTDSAVRHSGSTISPADDDIEPVQKKPRCDIETKPDGGSAGPPPTEGSYKTPFGCGCGKCTFFSCTERGCPTPITSISSFPYLDLSGLTHEQQEDLRGKLQFESQQIILQFQELVSATIKSLIKRNVSRDELVTHVMALGAFKPVFKEPQVPAFHHCFKELKAADTIPKVFLVLNDYFSFFNYHILEHIIKELGTEKDKTELQRYKEHFNQYATRRIFKCQPEFRPISEANHVNILVKLDSQYDEYTVTEINPLGPIAPKVALLTSYFFVASHFETKFAHELVVLLVVC